MVLSNLSSAIIGDPLTIDSKASAMQAIALMTAGANLCSFDCEMNAEEALLISQARRSCVLVLEDNLLVGMVCERDLVRLCADNRNLSQLAISDIMTPTVVKLAISDFVDFFAPLNLLQQHKIANLPLVNDQDQIVGLVTYTTLRRLLRPIDLFQLRTAAEIMVSEVVHAPPTASLIKLTQLMTVHKVSSWLTDKS